MIGAADLTIDNLADREVGSEMRAPGALHDRLSSGTAIDRDTCPEEVYTEDGAASELAGTSNRKPRLMKAGIIDWQPVYLLLIVKRFHLVPPILAVCERAHLVVHRSSPDTVSMPRMGSTARRYTIRAEPLSYRGGTDWSGMRRQG
jgi:hypothetical protein